MEERTTSHENGAELPPLPEEDMDPDSRVPSAGSALVRQEMAACWRRALDETEPMSAAMWVVRGAMLARRLDDRDVVDQATVLAHCLWGDKKEGDAILRTMIDRMTKGDPHEGNEGNDPFRSAVSLWLETSQPSQPSLDWYGSTWYEFALRGHLAAKDWAFMRWNANNAMSGNCDEDREKIRPLQSLAALVAMLAHAGPLKSQRTLMEGIKSGTCALDVSESRLRVAATILNHLAERDWASLAAFMNDDGRAVKEFGIHPPAEADEDDVLIDRWTQAMAERLAGKLEDWFTGNDEPSGHDFRSRPWR